MQAFELEDFYASGKHMNLTKRKVEKILIEVKSAIEGWEACAQQAFLDEKKMDFIKRQFERIDV